jgi:hypothetical protein
MEDSHKFTVHSSVSHLIGVIQIHMAEKQIGQPAMSHTQTPQMWTQMVRSNQICRTSELMKYILIMKSEALWTWKQFNDKNR